MATTPHHPETDLAEMLASIDIMQRPGRYTFVKSGDASLRAHAEAVIQEEEGTTLVLPVEQAAGLRQETEGDENSAQFEAAWLTLTVNSALHAVGLTAAVSTALSKAGIACNVLAGYHHDHLLVPYDRADAAKAAIRALRS
jgi:hypothetical protein